MLNGYVASVLWEIRREIVRCPAKKRLAERLSPGGDLLKPRHVNVQSTRDRDEQ
ncbi:hypothetical protein GCM10010869_21520 [Mesorhizobium tianshanense]|nr:hypothetical protein GCM10010869_21520 [Mesorhizobium tianshanense]